MLEIRILPELQRLIPPLSPEEYGQLVANLRAEGCRDALVIWQEEQALLDGHHRFAICQQYDIPYTVQALALPDLAAAEQWLLTHQLGRRNLTPEQMGYLRGKQYELQKHQGKRNGLTSDHCDPKLATAQDLARQHHVGEATMKRDAAFARAIDTIGDAVGDSARQTLLARATKLDRQDVKTLATIAEASPTAARHILAEVQAATTPKVAKELMRAAVKARPPISVPPPPPVPVLHLLPDAAPRRGLETLLSPEGRSLYILHNPDSTPVFNKTNEMVDWAAQTWNPVTGCWHDCDYCILDSTMILMADRTWQALGTLVVGDMVLGVLPQPGSPFEPTPVLAVNRHPQVMHALTTEAGDTLYCSEHHRWLTLDGATRSLTFKCWHDIIPGVDRIAGIDKSRLGKLSTLPEVQAAYLVKAVWCTHETVSLVDITTGTGNFIAEGLVTHNCYARDIANDTRMAAAYPKQFEPTFHPARLAAPANTPYPKVITRPADINVFVCSMADLFGKWVPNDWITQVFERVRVHPEWNFLFLTKFPQRLRDIGVLLGGFPSNAWLGCTVDAQARVATAERAFQDIEASVRWLSVEPMRERLTFHSLAMFDWLVMGGQSASAFNGTPASQPQWEWVEHLWQQARAAGVKVYWKENLTVRPKEVPGETLCNAVTT